MRGREVFYPVGWDDNGLPTERRVQNYYRVRCDPALAYRPGFTPAALAGRAHGDQAGDLEPVSRRNFIELCRALTEEDERSYADVWRRLGLSVDWSWSYRTIDDAPRAMSQRAFLEALARGDAYQADGPVIWDVSFGTAIAQAETVDREVAGHYWRLPFRAPDVRAGPAAEIIVATTRPELLPACVALVAHPADERYSGLVGTTVRTPLFGVPVPVLAHHLADPGKGTGIAMVCTFGDATDVTWWRDLGLDTRPVIGPDGRLAAAPPDAVGSGAGREAYQQLAGLTVPAALRVITSLLRESGNLRGDPEPVTHAVKFYEYGDQPLEIIAARQWYVRNGSGDPQLREALLARGRELAWHPAHMRSRYENWLNGLSGDWLISRQRYFGVPIPAWYRLDADGVPDYGAPLTPDPAALPVDPAADVPPGYRPDQRDVPGGFTADRDIMDTWATSSLTPQIAGGWGTDDDLYARVYPMDLRPQSHEIIRTWLFYTVLRSHLHGGRLPWRHAAISGWILDPDRKKMSKSAGNVVTPASLFDEYGADAVRYWSASARLGVDTAYEPAQLKVGRRLAVKILNATRFVLGLDRGEDADIPVSRPLDQAMLRRLAEAVAACTAALDGYEHAAALDAAERFFWLFCDDYLELVKPRARAGDQGAAGSAVTALRAALSVQLRLFAPVLPFVTEEAWSWWHDGSVHRAPWPEPGPLLSLAGEGIPGADGPARADGLSGTGGPAAADGLAAASAAIGAIRKAKSAARLPMRAEVGELTVAGPAGRLDALRLVLDDVLAAGRVQRATLRPADGDELGYDVTF